MNILIFDKSRFREINNNETIILITLLIIECSLSSILRACLCILS